MDYMREFGLKPADFRIKPLGLFEALRVYDALTYGEMTPTEVARQFFPNAFTELGDPDDARKKINDFKNRAKLMIEEKGYLRLVTRDYLDSRSRSSKR